MPETTLIVVPCYNEAKRLRPERFLAALADRPWLRLRFVDDGSADATPRILEALRADGGVRVEVIRCERNLGKAEAVRRGVIAPMAEEIRYFGYWDADLSTPLDELDGMVAIMDEDEDEEAEVVIASRVKLLGRDIHRRPLRHLLGRIFATAASMTLDLGVYDTQCGAKLFRRNEETLRAFSRPFLSRWIFDVELLARLSRGRESPDATRIVEHPVRRWTDVGDSKLRAPGMARAAIDLARIYAAYRPRD